MGQRLEDLDLVGRCIRREPGAWRVFVDRFKGTVKALGRRYLKLHGHLPDDGELEDVVQEVFVAVIRRDFRLLRNYDPTYTFKTYLGVITRTEVHRFLRKKRPLLGDPEDLERAAPAEADASVEAEESERRETVLKALEELPPRDGEILKLRFLREMDYKAIAAALQIPEASVGQTLYRAKQKLLDKLKGVFDLMV